MSFYIKDFSVAPGYQSKGAVEFYKRMGFEERPCE
jgi:hypothetical protein